MGSSQAPQVADLSERGRCNAEVAAHTGFWEAVSWKEGTSSVDWIDLLTWACPADTGAASARAAGAGRADHDARIRTGALLGGCELLEFGTRF